MIAIKFPENEGDGLRIKLSEKGSKSYVSCVKRFHQIMTERASDIDPAVSLIMAIAVTNGPKTFERVARYFNVV